MTIMDETQQQPRSSKILTWIASVSLLFIAFGVAVLLRWSFASEDVLQIKNSPFPSRLIANQTDRYVVLDTEYCKNQDINGKLRISFVNESEEKFLPIINEELFKGCSNNSIPIALPKDLTPGDYKVKFRATYNINPLKQNVVVEFESREFKLI